MKSQTGIAKLAIVSTFILVHLSSLFCFVGFVSVVVHLCL